MSSTGRLRTVGLVVLIVVTFGAAPAHGAATIEVASPRLGTLVTGNEVTVRVKLSGPLSRFSAELRGRTSRGGKPRRVTARFGPARGGVRTARLRGQDLVVGRNNLFIDAHDSRGRLVADSTHFVVGRRAPRALRVSGVARRETGAFDVRVRTSGTDMLTATLNGKAVSALRLRSPGLREGRLGAYDGLRFGANTLVLTAHNRRSGRYDRFTRRFRVTRRSPIPGAGRDRRGRVGAAIALDASSSKPADPHKRMSVRWKVVSQPRRGAARVLRATGDPLGARVTATRAGPRLIASRPGRYEVQLVTKQPGSPAATDVMSATVQPLATPAGVPIETIGSLSNPGVRVGSQFYPMDSPASNWAQVVVLDRATTAPSQNVADPNTTYPGTAAGLQDLVDYLYSLTSSELVIVSGGGGSPVAASDARFTAATLLVVVLGGAFPASGDDLYSVLAGEFSIIGVPVDPPQQYIAGSAAQMLGLSRGRGAPPGDIQGVLQPDTSAEFTFNFLPSYIPYDTQTPASTIGKGGTTVTNVMQVGSTTYPSVAVPADMAVSGNVFQLLLLDAASLEPQQPSITFGSDDDSCGGNTGLMCASAVATLLEEITAQQGSGQTLVMMTSLSPPGFYGGPEYDQQQYVRIVAQLATMGANRYAAAGLATTATGNYSFVGFTGMTALYGPNSGEDLAQGLAGGSSARLAGLLTRNNQGLFAGQANASPGPGVTNDLGRPELQKILATESSPYAPLSDAELAAHKYIGRQLFNPPAENPSIDAISNQLGVREYYYSENDFDWGSYSSDLRTLAPCSAHPCAEAFDAVKQALIPEWGDVEATQDYFATVQTGTLAQVFNASTVEVPTALTSIVSDITSLYDPPPVPAQGVNVTGVIIDSMTIASGAAAEIPGGGQASGVLTIAAGAAALANDLSTSPGGLPAFDPLVFSTDVYDFGKTLQHLLSTELPDLDMVSDLIVSDAGRLAAFSALFNAPSTPPPGNPDAPLGFDITSANATTLTDRLTLNFRRYVWQSLLPVPVFTGVCSYQSTNSSYYPQGGFVEHPSPDHSHFQEGNVVPLNTAGGRPQILDRDMLQNLFQTPPSEGGLGFEEPYFLSESVPTAISTTGFAYKQIMRDYPGLLLALCG